MKLHLLTALLICSFTCFAQNTKDSTRYYNQGSFGLIYQNQSFDNVNATLIKYFPRSIPQSSYGFVMGGKTAFNQLLVQGDIGFSFGANTKRGKGYTNLFLMNGGLDAGLFLTSPGTVRIYPYAGIALDLPVISAKMQTDNIPFDSVLSNPITREKIKPVTLSNFFASWRVGLGIDIGEKSQESGAGIRIGYKQSFHSGKWNLEGDNLFVNSPSDKLQQWYVSLVLYGKSTKARHKPKSHQSGDHL